MLRRLLGLFFVCLSLTNSFHSNAHAGEVDLLTSFLDVLNNSSQQTPTNGIQHAWIDAATVEAELSGENENLHGKLNPLFGMLKGIDISRQGDALEVSVEFKAAFNWQLSAPDHTPTWHPDALVLPKTLNFSLQGNDGVLTVDARQPWDQSLLIVLNSPLFLPRHVSLKYMQADLASGELQIEAGLLDGFVSVFAKNTFEPLQPKIDLEFFKTVARNFLWFLPDQDFVQN